MLFYKKFKQLWQRQDKPLLESVPSLNSQEISSRKEDIFLTLLNPMSAGSILMSNKYNLQIKNHYFLHAEINLYLFFLYVINLFRQMANGFLMSIVKHSPRGLT